MLTDENHRQRMVQLSDCQPIVGDELGCYVDGDLVTVWSGNAPIWVPKILRDRT